MHKRERIGIADLLIVSLLVALLFAASWRYAAAGIPAAPAKITITPEIPTVGDPVQIVVNGIWSDACVPYYVTHEISGTTILITAALPAVEVVCGQGESPWSITVDLAPLPAEYYQVEVDGAVSVSSTVSVAGNFVYLPAIRRE